MRASPFSKTPRWRSGPTDPPLPLGGPGRTLKGGMRLVLLSALVPFVAVAARAADSQVQIAPGHVDVHATAAPLSEVLDKLSRQTGMKVVYDAAVPRPLVTLDLKRRTATEAVLSVLEGLGLNYAVRLDMTGERVETLMLFPATSAPPSTPNPQPPVFQPPPPPGAVPDEDAADEEPPQEAPQLPVQQAPGIVPVPGVPQPGQPQPGAPQTESPQPAPQEPAGFPPGFFPRLPPNFGGQMTPPSSLVPAPRPSPTNP